MSSDAVDHGVGRGCYCTLSKRRLAIRKPQILQLLAMETLNRQPLAAINYLI
jgi:hypothetical protein